MRRPLLVAGLLVLPFLPIRAAHSVGSCPGGGSPTAVFSGTFGPEVEGGYVYVPFEVPGDITRVEARLCYDQPPTPLSSQIRNTIDLGLYEPLHEESTFWGEPEFRGWGGSSRLTAFVAPSGATNGFKPGPVPEGTWAAELGVAAVTRPQEGNPSGVVNWRLEIHLGTDAGAPWAPQPYDTTPRGGQDWYAGDFHVHSTHSGSAPMSTVIPYAFDEAGLDFITLSDYVTDRHHDELRSFQDAHPDKLIVRSAEVITYRGHINNHRGTFVDYRTGPLYEWVDGGAVQRAGARPPSAILTDIHDAGGWTQVNHPTTFPSKVPGFANLCRGCSWEYSDTETDWSLVDAMEVQTGPSGWQGHDPVQNGHYVDTSGREPGPNPFTPLAIEWWDRLRRQGHDITAVGSSDSHRAGQAGFTFSPVGHPTTMILADELSEDGVGDAIRAGHAYIRFFGADGPEVLLEAESLEGEAAMMGDSLDTLAATFTATVRGAGPSADDPQPRTLAVLHEGVPILTVPVPPGDFEFPFAGAGPGDYRLQLHRGSAIDALTNPITLCPTLVPNDARCA